ncbi:unnamed protein product, partial [Didymodactylos carnosus]
KPDEYRAQPGDMDLNTMYSTEYTDKLMQKVNAIKPTERRMIDAKFQAETTYRGDYRKWPGSKPPSMRAQSGYEPPVHLS